MAARTSLFVLIGACVIAGVAYLPYVHLNGRRQQKSSQTNQASSPNQHIDHRVTLQDGKARPENTIFPLCDTLTIINRAELSL